jgi:dynein heavy chain
MNFRKLWELSTQITNKTQSWSNNSIFILNPEEVETECVDMLKGASMLYGKMSKTYPKPAKKAGSLREKMINFNKNIDLISSLCNKDLKDRHWEGICDIFGLKEINKDDKKFTLSYFESSDIFKVKEKLERLKDISQRATQEASNEKALNDMIALWDEQLFQTKEWKKTGTYVLLGTNVDELLILQEEHLLKTQTMKGSPFAEVIRPRILEWEQWLDRTAKIMDEWKKLQSSWTGLESVFTSEDILQQLPVEGVLFREVDKAWRGLMQEAYSDQKVKKIMNSDKLKETLEQCNSKLEQVNKRLNDYLETKRLAFCRFFFLGNEQLLQILSDAKEPLKVQDHIGNCFDGIGLLDFTTEKKIKGMISKEGEKVGIVSVVDPAKSKGMVELWLSEVEDQMVISIRDIIEKGMNEYTTMKREDCIFY